MTPEDLDALTDEFAFDETETETDLPDGDSYEDDVRYESEF